MRLHMVISQSPGEFGGGWGSGGCALLTPTGHLQSNRLPNTQDAHHQERRSLIQDAPTEGSLFPNVNPGPLHPPGGPVFLVF